MKYKIAYLCIFNILLFTFACLLDFCVKIYHFWGPHSIIPEASKILFHTLLPYIDNEKRLRLFYILLIHIVGFKFVLPLSEGNFEQSFYLISGSVVKNRNGLKEIIEAPHLKRPAFPHFCKNIILPSYLIKNKWPRHWRN